MQDRQRRNELGRMFFDVAKYALTFVVIGGLVSDQMQGGTIILGILATLGAIGLGFFIIPREEKSR